MLKHFRSSRAFFVGATLLAVLGSLMLYGYLHGLELRVARDGNLLRLPVARVPIATGSVIEEDMLQVVEFPDLYVLPTMLLDADEAVGMVALHDIAAGDPFLQTSVSAHGQGAGPPCCSIRCDALTPGSAGEPGTPGRSAGRRPGRPDLRSAGGPGLHHPPRRARPLPPRR